MDDQTANQPSALRRFWDWNNAGVKRRREVNQFMASVATVSMFEGKIRKTFGPKHLAKDCEVAFHPGGSRERTTATRVLTGGLLGGGAGAIVGASAKKLTGSGVLVIKVPGDVWQIPIPAADYGKAEIFVAKWELEAERHRTTGINVN